VDKSLRALREEDLLNGMPKSLRRDAKLFSSLEMSKIPFPHAKGKRRKNQERNTDL
jgi:hypothetical protein